MEPDWGWQVTEKGNFIYTSLLDLLGLNSRLVENTRPSEHCIFCPAPILPVQGVKGDVQEVPSNLSTSNHTPPENQQDLPMKYGFEQDQPMNLVPGRPSSAAFNIMFVLPQGMLTTR